MSILVCRNQPQWAIVQFFGRKRILYIESSAINEQWSVCFWLFERASGSLFYLWNIQRSWCQNRGRRLHKWCHRSLFSLFHFDMKNSNILLGVRLPSLTWLGQGGGGGGEISSFIREQRAQGRICLLGKVNWLGGKVVMGERRKSGGRGTERRVRMVGYRSCDCTYRNPRYAPVLLLHRYAKQGCCLWKRPRKNVHARWAGQPGGRIVNNLVLSLIRSIPTFVIFGTSLLRTATFW